MKRLILILSLLFSKLVFAQPSRQISYGVYAGATYSTMHNLPDVIVSQKIYVNYNLKEEGRFGAIGGIFLNWKYSAAQIAIQPEIYYSKQSTVLNYNDIKKLEYKMSFNYNYINTGLLFKYYPIGQFYIGIGPYLGLNITRDNITYTSNGAEITQNTGVFYVPDAIVQKVLKESLKGNDYFYMSFGAGYEFNNKIMLGFRYNRGLSDALETQENGFRYIENNNKINSFSFHIGYIFEFDDTKNF